MSENKKVYREVKVSVYGQCVSTFSEHIWEEIDHWLNERGFTREDILTIPSMELDMEQAPYDNDDHPVLYAFFHTLETDEEVQERLRKEKRIEDIQRKQYEMLKEKFEDS